MFMKSGSPEFDELDGTGAYLHVDRAGDGVGTQRTPLPRLPEGDLRMKADVGHGGRVGDRRPIRPFRHAPIVDQFDHPSARGTVDLIWVRSI